MVVKSVNYLNCNAGLPNNGLNSSDIGMMNAISSSNLLERTPQKDTLTFKGNTPNLTLEKVSYFDIQNLKNMTGYSRPSDWKANYTMDMIGSGHPLDNFHVKIENKLIGREIKGQIFTKNVDLKLKSAPFNLYKGSIVGTIDGQKVDIKYQESNDRKGFVIDGNIPDVGEVPHEDFVSVLSLFAYDHMKQCQQQMQI